MCKGVDPGEEEHCSMHTSHLSLVMHMHSNCRATVSIYVVKPLTVGIQQDCVCKRHRLLTTVTEKTVELEVVVARDDVFQHT